MLRRFLRLPLGVPTKSPGHGQSAMNTEQNKTKQNKTEQNRTKQNKTKHKYSKHDQKYSQ
jgi:hypothetical protein